MSRDPDRYRPNPNPPEIHLVSMLDDPKLWDDLEAGKKIPYFKVPGAEKLVRLLDGSNVRIRHTFWDEKIKEPRTEFWMAEIVTIGPDKYLKCLYRAD